LSESVEQVPKYLAIKNWKRYQPQLSSRPARYFRMYSDRDHDPEYSKLTRGQRYLLDGLMRLRARFGCNPRNDAAWVSLALGIRPAERSLTPHDIVALVSLGFLIPTNQQFNFEKVPIEEKSIQEKRIEDTPPNPLKGEQSKRKKRASASGGNGYTPEFLEVWATYPRTEGKFAAFKAYQKIQPGQELREKIIASIQEHAADETWQRDGGRYIPHLSTFLNQRRFEDEPVH
jgi:hypothetical protein